MKFKKILTLATALTICFNSSFVFSSSKTPDFKNHNWGDNINQVIKTEYLKNQAKDTTEKGTTLTYNNSDGCLVYYFDKSDRLYQSIFIYLNKAYNNIATFNSTKAIFNTIYGKCNNKSDMKWISNSKKYTKTTYDKAVANGDLELIQTWNYGDTVVDLELVQNGKSECLAISYYCNSSLDNVENTSSDKTSNSTSNSSATNSNTTTNNNTALNQDAYNKEYKALTDQYEATKKELTDKAYRAYQNAIGSSKDGQINSWVKSLAEKAQQPYLDALKELEEIYTNEVNNLKKRYGISN